MILFGLVIDVRVIDYVIFFQEQLLIENCDLFFLCDWLLFYVYRNLEEKMCVLNILVQEQQSTCIHLQVSVGDFKKFVPKQGELVLDEFHSLFDSLEILSECLSFLTLL